jgi:hypothetical protein
MRIVTPSRPASSPPHAAGALALMVWALLAFTPSASHAQCTTGSDCLWPVGCGFATPLGVSPIVTLLPPYGLRGITLIDLPSCTVTPASGTYNIDSFFDVFFDITLDGGATWQPKHASGHGLSQLVPTLAIPARQFDTEMLALSISGGDLPGGFSVRESPSRASTGHTQDTPSGGGFQIDSFFDVFVELSVDGGVSWMPALQSTRLQLGTPAPTAVRSSTWGALKSFYR